MLKKLVVAVLVLGGIGATGGWVLSAPGRVPQEMLAQVGPGDAARGQRIFFAGGCSSCHAKPNAAGDARFELGGGREMKTEFGTFVPPNISSHPTDGIGGWSLADFSNAMLKGVSPEGKHYYPAFPYTSYARMRPADIGDLYAFLKTTPPVEGKAKANDVSFPFSLRRGIGLWKLLYLDGGPVVDFPEGTPQDVLRGRYLVEGPGHCGECHTPRAITGGTRKDQWLAGAVAAEGPGTVPNITPGEAGIGSWSQSDIASYLETGFTPEFDTAGGAMAEVQENMARLTPQDRDDIAAYLKAIPPHANGYPAKQAAPAPQG